VRDTGLDFRMGSKLPTQVNDVSAHYRKRHRVKILSSRTVWCVYTWH